MAYRASDGTTVDTGEGSTTGGPTYIEPPPWHTEDWDTGAFDGEQVPGLMAFSSFKRGPKWDRKPVAGQTGETQTFKGWNNASFTIEIRTWTRQQYDDFIARILPIIEPEPGKEAPKEVGIDHPITRARKVESFKIEELDGPKAEYEKGYTVWTISAFQALKKAPQKGGVGGPGLSPCQQARATYDSYVAAYSAAMNAYNVILTNASSVPPETITAAQNDLFAAQARMEDQASLLDSNGCNNQTPDSQAHVEGPPAPGDDDNLRGPGGLGQ